MSQPREPEPGAAVVAPGCADTEPEPGSWQDGAAAVDTARLERGAGVGRFIVVDELGAGGMGVVYSAYDPELDRRVAIKLMRPDVYGPSRSEEARARVQREARALAQLSHPNVVAVFDVGTSGDEMFLAMEIVEGSSLADWLRERDRGWQEIVAAFVEAARGLQAAHDAGLVHRDFKPQNVLVGADGRIKVTDFGLVTGLSDGPGEPDEGELDVVAGTGSLVDAALTRTGVVLGTPRYMGPEHYAGRVSDPRADQFSFCLALYEALYGQDAFEASDYATRKQLVSEGRVRPPPKDSAVPSWIGQALARGLSAAPERRFASMSAVIDALTRDPRAAMRRRLAVGAGVIAALALGAGIVGVAGSGAAREPCPRPDRAVARVWNAQLKRQIGAAFAATGKSYAEDTRRRVVQQMDRYVGEWADMHQQACRATHVDGAQSAELLDLRMACLSSRLAEVGGLAARLAEADDALVRRATNATYQLSSLAECADSEALLAVIRPPTTDETRAEVERVREIIAAARAQRAAGAFEEGVARASEALAAARNIDYRPLLAEALYTLGNLQIEANREDAALATLEDAVYEADACRYDRIVAMALTDTIFATRSRRAEPAHVRDWERRTRAVLERMGGDHKLEAALESHLGAITYERGEFEAAQQHWQHAVALWEQAHAPGHPQLGRGYSNLGLAAANRGLIDEAASYQRRALANVEQSLGPNHPVTGDVLNNLGEALLAAGDYAGAASAYERAAAVWAGAFGAEHPRVGIAKLNQASLAVRVGRYGEAAELLAVALELFTKGVGAVHTLVAYTEITLSAVARGNGDGDAALAHGQRAVEIWTAEFGADNPLVGLAEVAVGDALLELGQHKRALAPLQRALELLEAAHGADHYNTAFALHTLGEARLAAGDSARALPLLERAVAIRDPLPAVDLDRARSRFALARALVASAGDLARARDLATDAQAAYQRAGAALRGQRERVDAWLAALGTAKEAR